MAPWKFQSSISDVTDDKYPVFQILECSSAGSIAEDLVVSCSHRSRIGGTGTKTRRFNWSFLFVAVFIAAGGLGNILVCLAVGLDRKLHNVTNYFLLSLAMADLLVSLFVMPLGAIPGFLGEFRRDSFPPLFFTLKFLSTFNNFPFNNSLLIFNYMKRNAFTSNDVNITKNIFEYLCEYFEMLDKHETARGMEKGKENISDREKYLRLFRRVPRIMGAQWNSAY